MSMSEPLLPHPPAEPDRTAAAEPGPGGPPPTAPEEPDVLPGEPADENEPRPSLPPETPFRTPRPGERLHPEDLADDDDDVPGGSTS
jgi:hypothetical protein